MGSILMVASSFRRSLSDDAGARSGLALSREELVAALGPDHPLHTQLCGEGVLRIRSEDYADAVGDVLYELGAADMPGMPPLASRFHRIIGRDWRDIFGLEELLELSAVANEYLCRRSDGRPDQQVVLEDVRERLCGKPDDVHDAFFKAMSIHLAHSPFFSREAGDLIALRDLFRSERLPEAANTFFDQRFINYLAQHPDKLTDMHWRQFEAMTAEWFSRNGYEVNLGSGRNDGGVDMRLWPQTARPGDPPAVIVQCKRQSEKVEQVVVKALHADVSAERADSGMVVTTSDLAPGAHAVIKARSYPVTSANQAEVRRWIAAMRCADAGINLK